MNKLLIKKLDFRQRVRGYAHSASVAVPALVLLCAIAGGSCTKEIDDAPGGSAGGGTHDVTIALSPSLDNVVDVKAYNSWHNATDVRNLWIIQLSTDGTRQLCEPRYVTSFRNAGGQYRCEASLVKGGSQVIFLANTNDPALVPATGNTLASIQKLNYAFSSGVSKGEAIPAFATWTGAVSRFKTISATLTRTSALLDLTIRTDELPDIYTVTMNEIRIEQMPMAIHYLFPKNATPYPDANESFGRLVGLSGSVTQDLTKKTFNKYFDISPNVRGSGTAREPKDKNASTCPTGESNRCGYVNVRFNIATTDGAFSETENVRIYLGQNATNDFNIYPGDIIKLTLNIKGFKRYDTRIQSSNTKTIYMDYPNRFSRIQDEDPGNAATLKEAVASMVFLGNRYPPLLDPGPLRKTYTTRIGAGPTVNTEHGIVQPTLVFLLNGKEKRFNPTAGIDNCLAKNITIDGSVYPYRMPEIRELFVQVLNSWGCGKGGTIKAGSTVTIQMNTLPLEGYCAWPNTVNQFTGTITEQNARFKDNMDGNGRVMMDMKNDAFEDEWGRAGNWEYGERTIVEKWGPERALQVPEKRWHCIER